MYRKNYGLIRSLKQTGIMCPKDNIIVVLNAETRNVESFEFDSSDTCYDAFNAICAKYEDMAIRDHSLKVDFPRGCFGTDERDEPIEDYGTIMFVFVDNVLSLIVEQQNPDYYGN